jgi:hypothetical protein
MEEGCRKNKILFSSKVPSFLDLIAQCCVCVNEKSSSSSFSIAPSIKVIDKKFRFVLISLEA